MDGPDLTVECASTSSASACGSDSESASTAGASASSIWAVVRQLEGRVEKLEGRVEKLEGAIMGWGVPRLQAAASEVLLRLCDATAFKRTSKCTYYEELGVDHSHVRELAGLLGCKPHKLIKHADRLITRRNRRSVRPPPTAVRAQGGGGMGDATSACSRCVLRVVMAWQLSALSHGRVLQFAVHASCVQRQWRCPCAALVCLGLAGPAGGQRPSRLRAACERY